MQKIEIHPVSLLAGAALAVLAFVAMAPAPPPSTQPTPNGLVPARAMVQIYQGTPYIVPAGQLLVVTGVGSTVTPPPGTASSNNLSVNGVTLITTQPGAQGINQINNTDNLPECRSMVPVPTGFAIAQGSVVTVSGVAWGYLERY